MREILDLSLDYIERLEKENRELRELNKSYIDKIYLMQNANKEAFEVMTRKQYLKNQQDEQREND